MRAFTQSAVVDFSSEISRGNARKRARAGSNSKSGHSAKEYTILFADAGKINEHLRNSLTFVRADASPKEVQVCRRV